jgi:antitoxin component YwqK of YwqJK toxin-antitoxin module
MKRILIVFILFLTLTRISYCQKVDTLFYTRSFKEASAHKYTFYRIVRHDSTMVKVFDYWKYGKIFMSGGFKSNDFKVKTGPFIYYKKDRISKYRLYEPSKYQMILSSLGILKYIPSQSDSLDILVYFHKNGNINAAGYVSECCKKNGRWIFISKDTAYVTIENYRNGIIDGPFVNYYKGYVISTGYYKNAKKDGDWSYYNDEHVLFATEIYSHGKRIKVSHK